MTYKKRLYADFLLVIEPLSKKSHYSALNVVDTILTNLLSIDEEIVRRLFIFTTDIDILENSEETKLFAKFLKQKLQIIKIANAKEASSHECSVSWNKRAILPNRTVAQSIGLWRYIEVMQTSKYQEGDQYMIFDVTSVENLVGGLIAKDIPIDRCLPDDYIYLSASRVTRYGPTIDWMIVGPKMLQEFGALRSFIENTNQEKRKIRFAMPVTWTMNIYCFENFFMFKYINTVAFIKYNINKIGDSIKNQLSRSSLLNKIIRKVALSLLAAIETSKPIPGISAINTNFYTKDIDGTRKDTLRNFLILAYLQEKDLYKKVRLISRSDFILGKLH